MRRASLALAFALETVSSKMTLCNHVEGVAKLALPLLLLLTKTVSLSQEFFSRRPHPKGVNKR